MAKRSDTDRARAMGLLNAGLGIMASANVPYGGSAIPGIAAGLQHGLNSYNDTLEQIVKERKASAEAEEVEAKARNLSLLMSDPSLTPAQRAAFGVAPEAAARSMFARPGQERLYDVIGPDGKPIKQTASKAAGMEPYIAPRTPTISALGKLIQEMPPPGDPRRAAYEQAIRKHTSFAPPIKLSVETYQAPVPVINPETGEEELVQFGSRGGERPTGFKPRPQTKTDKPTTEGERKTALFASQMASAASEIDAIMASNPDLDPSSIVTQAQTELAGTPFRGLASPQAQQLRQAQEQWLEAYLRFKSGAAFTQSDIKANIDTYFPRIGETSPEIIEQKARQRALAEEDMITASGRGAVNVRPKRLPDQAGTKLHREVAPGVKVEWLD